MIEDIAFKIFVGSSWLTIVSCITWLFAQAMGNWEE